MFHCVLLLTGNSLEVPTCKYSFIVFDNIAIRIADFIKHSLANGKILVEVK